METIPQLTISPRASWASKAQLNFEMKSKVTAHLHGLWELTGGGVASETQQEMGGTLPPRMV